MAATFLVNGTFTVDHTKLDDSSVFVGPNGNGDYVHSTVTGGALGHIAVGDGTNTAHIDFVPAAYNKTGVPSASDGLVLWMPLTAANDPVHAPVNPRDLDTYPSAAAGIEAVAFFGPGSGTSVGSRAALWDCFPIKHSPNTHTREYSMPNGTYSFRLECINGLLRGWFNGYQVLTFGDQVIDGDATLLAKILFDTTAGSWFDYDTDSSPLGARVTSVDFTFNQFWTSFRNTYEQVS